MQTSILFFQYIYLICIIHHDFKDSVLRSMFSLQQRRKVLQVAIMLRTKVTATGENIPCVTNNFNGFSTFSRILTSTQRAKWLLKFVQYVKISHRFKKVQRKVQNLPNCTNSYSPPQKKIVWCTLFYHKYHKVIFENQSRRTISSVHKLKKQMM